MRLVISNMNPDDQAAVVRVLEALRRCAGMPLVTRTQVAALSLLPAAEMREEIDAVLRLAEETVPDFVGLSNGRGVAR